MASTLLSMGLAGVHQATAQSDTPVPAELTAAANVDSSWEVPHFSWGDPNLEGTFTSRDMSGIPMARPTQFGTRDTLNAEEYLQRASGGGGGLGSLRGGDEFEGEARLQLSALDASEVGTREAPAARA